MYGWNNQKDSAQNKMKKMVFLFIFVANMATGQTFSGRFDTRNSNIAIDSYKSFTKGYNSYLLVTSSGYAMATAGKSFQVTKELTIGASLGIQTGNIELPVLVATDIFWSHKKISLLVLAQTTVENPQRNAWYKIEFKYSGKIVSPYIFAQRYVGAGILTDAKISKSVTLFGGPLYDIDAQGWNIPIGIKINMN